MSKRSKWKGPNFINKNIEVDTTNYYKKISRNTTVVPFFVGQTFLIHNGKSFNEITVVEKMINHKFGEFVPTRKINNLKKKNGAKK